MISSFRDGHEHEIGAEELLDVLMESQAQEVAEPAKAGIQTSNALFIRLLTVPRVSHFQVCNDSYARYLATIVMSFDMSNGFVM